MGRQQRCYDSLTAAGYTRGNESDFSKAAIAGKNGSVAISRDFIGANKGARERFYEEIVAPLEAGMNSKIQVGDSFTVAVVRAHAGTPVYDEDNEGNGTLGAITVPDDAEDETLELLCTDDSTPGEEVFSVIGSESGAHNPLTVGAAYSDDGFGMTLAAGASPFQEGDRIEIPINAQVVGPAVKAVDNVGSYTVAQPTADLDTPTQSFEFTCTNADTEGEEAWSNVGSAAGAQDTATTGVPYDDMVQLEIVEPATVNVSV